MTAQVPDAASLGNWLSSWVREDGSIYGFHNHSVWGGNPYRWLDFTSGHSTWTSPFIAALADALRQCPDPRGEELLRRMVDFQTASFQEDGNYEHIGFQVGETLKRGLIHNAITNVSLGLAACLAPDALGDTGVDTVRRAFERNVVCHGRPNENATCNQDYARIWAKLLFADYADDNRFRDSVRGDIDYMIEHFHVRGLPDGESAGTLRSVNDTSAVEPAEYYGLMISPLVRAASVYGDTRYFDEAVALARHVVRSSWTDSRGAVRFHRLWYRRRDEWAVNREPMLISGMGDTLAGILDIVETRGNRELEAFLADCDRTYAAYQHPRGFFAAATGWQSEVDVAPSSAWHAHDFRYLVRRAEITPEFWDRMFAPDGGSVSVLLGDQCLWAEVGPHWAVSDYFWQDVFNLRGRKDRGYFGREMGWVGGPRALPDAFSFPGLPTFRKTESGIALVSGDAEVSSIASVPYLGSD